MIVIMNRLNYEIDLKINPKNNEKQSNSHVNDFSFLMETSESCVL